MLARGDIKKNNQANASAEKELSKLRRLDLLEMLLDQIRENESNSTQLEELTDLTARLKAKLDDKDAQIEHLKQRLDAKDAQIAQLQEENNAAAHAGNQIDLNELMRVQREAAEQYMKRIADNVTARRVAQARASVAQQVQQSRHAAEAPTQAPSTPPGGTPPNDSATDKAKHAR